MPLNPIPVKDERWGFTTHGQEAVFRCLADLAADADGHEISPSQEWVAHVTTMHKKSVNAIIMQLKDMGLVEKVRGGNRYGPGVYRVNIPEGYPVHGEGTEYYNPQGAEQGGLFD